MRVLKIAIITAALTCGSAAAAENLVFYDYTKDGSFYYFDTESIRKNGNIIYVWTFEDAQKNKKVSYRSVRDRWRIDCDNETMGIAATASYRGDGSVYDSFNFPYPEMNPAIPESVGYSLLEAVCAQ